MSLNLEQLNPQQLEAVTMSNQDVLILAGAGSGKTKVLSTRIAWLLANNQAYPSQILAVTFTNKAANEMLERIQTMTGFHRREMWVGTFHGICHRLLRQHFLAANLPKNFQIIDQSEQLSLIKRVLQNLNLDEKIITPRSIQNFINSKKEEGTRAENADCGVYPKKYLEIYLQYQNICQSEGLLDFAELLLRAYELLLHNQPLQQHYQQRFKYILVDEFQDTNQLQYSWLLLLAGKNQLANSKANQQFATNEKNLINDNCIFAVGDDDQSIYSFRGATIDNIQRFSQDYAKKIIRLEQNYRSGEHILGAANALISSNQSRLGKNLWTNNKSCELVNIFAANSDIEEVNFIVDEIQKLHRQGVDYSQIAILYRSNFQSRMFEQELFLRQIPYRIYGGNRFFDRQEIKNILAYCRLADNLDDNSAFLRIVNFPARGIGEKTIAKIITIANQFEISYFAAIKHLTGKTLKTLEKFQQIIFQIQNDTSASSLSEMIEIVSHLSGICDYYSEENEETRLENIQELINAATKFSEENQELNLSDFLAHTALESADSDNSNSNKDPVQLMTIHSAKVLEFEVVFIAGIEQGLLPHQNAESFHEKEEERRLFYVAITRAKRLLYLTFSYSRMMYGKYNYTMISSFINEIPEKYLNLLNSKQKRKNSSIFSSNSADLIQHYPANKQESNNLPNELNKLIKTNETSSPTFAIGQQVKHNKFGIGTIINAENGSDIKVQIRFIKHGEKWLLLKFAQLEIV